MAMPTFIYSGDDWQNWIVETTDGAERPCFERQWSLTDKDAGYATNPVLDKILAGASPRARDHQCDLRVYREDGVDMLELRRWQPVAGNVSRIHVACTTMPDTPEQMFAWAVVTAEICLDGEPTDRDQMAGGANYAL